MLTQPTFTTQPPRSTAGDFLGMGAIGERMYGGVFPGLNNAARHVRPYTALCWIIYRLQQSAFSQGMANVAELRRQTEQGIWKMQLLMNWIARLDGAPGYPGTERFEGDPQTALLRKESWPSIGISFWDQAWYQPSLLNGLRFLNAGTKELRGTYSCTDAGIALAQAYEAAVQNLDPELATWLADPDALTCTKARVESLRPVLALDKPSAGERSAFLRQYFSAEFEQGQEGGKRRRKGLVLALRTVAALQEEDADQTVETIRHVMAAGITPGGEPIDVTGVEATQVQWSVLQVRALQRLAMEALLGVAERQILQAEQTGQPRRTGDIADAIAAYLAPSADNTLLARVEENYQWVREAQGAYATAQAAGLVEGNEHISLAALKAQLRGNAGHDAADWPGVTRQAIWSLIVCAAEADNLAPMTGAKRLLGWDAGKLSLNQLRATVRKHRDDTVDVFTRRIIESFVIAQHINVAVERSADRLDGKNRFVFSQERDGLTRYADTAAARFVNAMESGDILFHALLMLENCGKLASTVPDDKPAYTHRLLASFSLQKSAYNLLQEFE